MFYVVFMFNKCKIFVVIILSEKINFIFAPSTENLLR
jgi:hypothetical protein